MPVTNETILRKVQAGIEITRGTAAAATRKVYAQVASSYDRPMSEFADTTGTFEARRRMAYGRQAVGFSVTDLLTYEDAAWWAELALKGGVAGVTDAGTPPAFTYTFVPTLAADDLSSVTFEHGEPGNVYKSTQCMVNSWTIRADSDSDNEPAWMFEADMMGRDWVTSTYTAAVPDRVTEVITAKGTKVYIDPAGGTIGTTQVTGKLISFSVTGNNNVHFKGFAEDILSMAANKVGRGPRTFDAQFVMEFDSDTEFANFRADPPVQRVIRLERTGTQIHGTTVVNKTIQLDILGFWSGFSQGDRDGNITATYSLAGYFDSVAGKTLSLKVINALATLV